MSRRLAFCAVVAVFTLAAEFILGIHGHGPTGAAALLGIGGSLLLGLGAKALGRAGVQQPDAGGTEGDGA